MINKKVKKIFIVIFILFFLIYVFLNIFYFSKNDNNIPSLEKPIINLNKLDKSISLEEPHYEKKYFMKIFINDFLQSLDKQSFSKNENILINFYFDDDEIYVETNLINLNYTYHYYLV